MSSKNAVLPDAAFPKLASSSTRTWYSTVYSSSSLLSHSCSSESQADADLLEPLNDITLDSDLDQRTVSSATLLSRRISSSLSTNQPLIDANCTSSKSDLFPSESPFFFSLREPGQMTAHRIQRLRARTAAIIMSLPATSEDVDDYEPPDAIEPTVTPASRLRRVAGIRDLRSAFRDGNDAPVHLASTSPLEASKASYELGILPVPTSSLSPLSPRSSLRTLVDVGNTLPKKVEDMKIPWESALSSISISSRLTSKLHSPFSPSSQTLMPTDASQPIFPTKYHVHNLSPRSRRHTSLQLDTRLPRSPREAVWSCAKISQSAVKRAARHGHTPRRIFSNPIAAQPP